MGNAHVFGHRLPAIGAASLATVAAVLLTVAGTTCSFLEVTANRGQLIEVTQDTLQIYLNSLSIGVLCEGDYYERSGDTMWEVSRIFWIISVGLGYIICALAWAVSFLVPPNDSNWKLISVLSALTAVLQMPIFLIFEADPCSEYSARQNCSVSTGGYMLIASTIFWIALTLFTQFMDPPRWAIELNVWKVRNENASGSPRSQRHRQALSDEDDENEIRTAPVGILGGIGEWHRRRQQTRDEKLKMKNTESLSRDEEEGVFAESNSYYADSNNSRLVLKVMPNGRRPGDDEHSARSFGDLDDFSMQSSLPSSPAQPLAGESLLGEESEDEVETILLGESLVQTRSAAFPQANESHPPEAILATNGVETSDLESGYITTSPKVDKKALLEDSPARQASNAPANGQGVIVMGIRALTNRMKRETKTKGGNEYAVVESEDEASQQSRSYAPPSSAIVSPMKSEPISTPAKGAVAGDVDDLQSASSGMDDSEAPSSLASEDRRAREMLTKDWNALHAAAASGVPLANNGSPNEDEPEPVYYSSDETRSLVSLSSYGNIPDNEGDESSSLSSSSYSDSSDGEGGRRRRRRKSRSRRTFSCGDSVSSRTSVIEYTINEETEVDLEEFESASTPPRGSYPLQRTQSAPDPRHHFTSRKLKIRSIDEGTADSSGVSSVLRLASVPITVECHDDMEPLLSGEETSRTGYTSDAHRLEGYNPSADEASSFYRRSGHRGRSMSVPRSKLYGTSDEDDRSVASQPESRTPWHDERYKMGIHSEINVISDESSDNISDTNSTRTGKSNMSRRARRARIDRLQRETGAHSPVRRRSRTTEPPRSRTLSARISRSSVQGPSAAASVVSDEDNSSDNHSARTAHSNLSRRARRARIRRLQRETEDSEKRPRSRTLDPPRKRSDGSRIQNVVSPSLNLILVERESGMDYGPDEASL